ncbi:Uncharacterized protein TCM_000527 [Theobroma cacao]|uniref:Uncharacterized protein n=1 Tax=Theobroma cacao TaxID=3641 RepID=A0A061DG63_THECC|nr:Uncharacterized protein TCM_000527 [Theobroma cacao]
MFFHHVAGFSESALHFGCMTDMESTPSCTIINWHHLTNFSAGNCKRISKGFGWWFNMGLCYIPSLAHWTPVLLLAGVQGVEYIIES